MLAVAALLAQPAEPRSARVVNLTLPHVLREGETAVLEIKLGVLARDQRIVIETVDGRLVGDLSPYGIQRGQAAGRYTVPLPGDAVSRRRVSLRLSLQQGKILRAPTRSEVQQVRLRIMPAVS
jgi:hypothetical protein